MPISEEEFNRIAKAFKTILDDGLNDLGEKINKRFDELQEDLQCVRHDLDAVMSILAPIAQKTLQEQVNELRLRVEALEKKYGS